MRRAFTLLELLIVLAIILMIAGISVVSFQRQMARARFKAGVVEIQIDLHKARLLAMKTGTPYIFRYAPGSGVYEIAPLDALQEAIYRQNDATDLTGAFGDESLAGSLAETAFPSDSEGGAAPNYADDLFSPENVAADMKRLGLDAGNAFGADFGFDSAAGGSLDALAFDASALGNAADAGADFADSDFSTDGGAVGLAVDPLTGLPLGSATDATNWRELKPEEKALLVDGGETLVWRVAPEGAIFRKSATGDVVFTFMRISASTPLNLKTRRATGLDRTEAEATDDALGDGTFRSRLTGSLAAPPELAEDSPFAAPKLDGADALSGGLDEYAETLGLEPATAEGSAAASSVWSEPIVFYPNGRVSSAIFGIACVGSIPYYSEIAIRGMTGVARISSISTLPPGADPGGSALTQEQLFRLANPYAVATNPDGTSAATENELGAATGSSADVGNGSLVDSIGIAGAGAVGEATSGAETADAPRSGYRFDVPTTSTPEATDPLALPSENADAVDPNAGGLL